MIGILNRWRQFGRRYFWPHLLLGMVAASLGLPNTLNNTTEQPAQAEAPACNSNSINCLNIDSLLNLQESSRRSTFNVDYWHQHAIRTVIRHLSFALVPQAAFPVVEAHTTQAQHLALLDTLTALLTQESKPPVLVRKLAQVQQDTVSSYQPAVWLAQVQGIRAGPLS